MPTLTPSSTQFGTFGIYRYLLACMVVVTHLGPQDYSRIGNYAVFAFYILSGYVVSYILTHHYLPAPDGMRKFAINRFLRIFPMYWMVMLASLALLLQFPKEAHEILPFYTLPEDPRDWIWNLTTIGMSDPLTGALNQFAIVPGSWSLGIELMFWAMMPVFLTSERIRRRLFRFAVIYALFGVAVCIYARDLAKPIQYFNALAATLPFATGLWLFLRKTSGAPAISHTVGCAAMLALVALVGAAPIFNPDPYAIGFSGAFLLNAVLVAYLCNIDPSTLPKAVARADEWLGNIAYPLYLVQVPVGLSIYLLVPSLPLRGAEIVLATIAASTVVSWLIYRVVDIRVNAIRRRIKNA